MTTIRTAGRRAAAIIALSCLAFSCGSEQTPADSGLYGTSSMPPAPTLSPTPTAATPSVGSTSVMLDGQFSTKEGYRFGLDVELVMLPPVKTVIHDQPGFATVEREFDSSSRWQLTNRLPGREAYYNSNVGDIHLGVWGFYKANRPICKGLKAQRYEITFTGKQLGKTCGVIMAHFVNNQPGSKVLSPAETITGSFSILGGTEPKWGFRHIAEDVVDGVVADLTAGPDVTVVLLENALNVTGWRTPFQSTFDDDTVCLLDPSGIGGDAVILFLLVGKTQGSKLTQYANCRG